MEILKKIFYPKSKENILKSISGLLTERKILSDRKEIIENDFQKCVEGIQEGELKKSFEDSYFEDLYYVKKDAQIIDEKIKQNCLNLVDVIKKGNDLKYVDKLKGSLGKKREEMPQVDADSLGDFLVHFADKVGVKKVKKSIKSLKPTQDEVNEDKVYKFISHYFDEEKSKDKDKNRYIISSDGYLLDGHHRWAADLEMDDTQKVHCYKIDMPINQLLSRAKRMNLSSKKDIDDNKVEKAIEIPEEEFIRNNLAIKKAFDEGMLSPEIMERVKAENRKKVRISKVENDVEKFYWVNKN